MGVVTLLCCCVGWKAAVDGGMVRRIEAAPHLIQEDCWADCMSFEDVLEQIDTDCHLRTVESIEVPAYNAVPVSYNTANLVQLPRLLTYEQAISELDPGQITGRLSSIFRDLLTAIADQFGYDPDAIIAAPVRLRCSRSRARALTSAVLPVSHNSISLSHPFTS